jgi:hypothetical protein
MFGGDSGVVRVPRLPVGGHRQAIGAHVEHHPPSQSNMNRAFELIQSSFGLE